MVKFKLYFDKDTETKWLNEMSQKGYALKNFVMGFYSFRKCTPGEYVYQIDMVDGFFQVDDDYKSFMEDAGVELVCMWGFWVILQKKAADGPFDLYTDVESRIEHYSKIKRMLKVAAVIEIICLVILLLNSLKLKSLAVLSYSFVIMALTVGLIRQVMHVNKILAELKDRIGEPLKFAIGTKRKLSGFITWGFLFNSLGFLARGWEYSYSEFVSMSMHGLALVFFIIGIICTLRVRK